MNRLMLLVPMLLLLGCPKVEEAVAPKAEAPQDSIGWNPATMRCQNFDGTKFHGEFLPNEQCMDQPMPKALPE